MAETLKKYLDQTGLEQLVANIKAEDTKTLNSAKSYADGLAKNYDAAGSAATAESNAKAYADSLAGNYDASGSAATVQGKLDEEVLRAKAAEEANAAAAKKAQDEVDELELVVQNIQENAYDDTEIRGLISGLDTNKADKTQVATDIAAAVKVEEDARKEAVAGVQSAVDTLSGTHATDKAALEAAIALKADKTALDGVSEVANAAATKTALQEEVTRATGEEARIEGLVTAEAAKAREEEGKLDARLVEVETFFKTAEGETLDAALDTLVEIQNYVTSEGAAADQMVLDIAANKKAIEDHVATDHDFGAADEALKAELNGEIAKKAAQADLEALSGTVATKAAQADLEAIDGRVGNLETASATHALKTEVEAVSEALSEYEDAHAGDYTNAQIDAAIKVVSDNVAALNDTYASDEELAQAIQSEVNRANGAYAAKSLETTVSNHVADTVAHVTAEDKTKWNSAEQNAKTYADGLNTAMTTKVNGIDGRLTTVEGSVATKAEADDLEAAVERISANETAIAANTSAIAAFSAISVGDIDALFA